MHVKKHLYRITLFAAALATAVSAKTHTWTASDLSWGDSGGASSSVSADTLTITAAKNSTVSAPLPDPVVLSESGERISVSFDITVSGGPFADDGSSLRIGFANSNYTYFAAFEPVGGASQAIFGETDDPNLGRFDSFPLGTVSRSVTFTLDQNDLTGLILTASGSAVDEAGNSISADPDILPAAATNFTEVFIYLAGSLWLDGQTLVFSNLSVEAIQDDPSQPDVHTFSEWAAAYQLAGNDAEETADPDGDRFSNLVEYATGGRPLQTDPSPMTAQVQSNMIVVSYPRRISRNDLSYTLQTCASLVSNAWKTAAARAAGSPIAESNGILERATFSIETSNRTGFVRLLVATSNRTAAVVSPVELLENGTFEDGSSGWTADGQHTIVSDVVYSGNYALRYEASDNYAGVQVFNIVGGRQYKVSGWIKTGDDYTDEAGISVNFRDMDATNLGSDLIGRKFGPGVDWTNVEAIVTAPTNAVIMKALLNTGYGTGYVWYDDLSVLPWEHPADPAVAAPADPPIAGTWTATFTDEFSGTGLDGSKWQVSGLNGFAVSSPDRVAVSNGVLHIRAEKIPAVLKGVSNDWSSAQLSTFMKFKQLYGYWEARIRYDTKVGLWPAFWTMPDHGNYGDTNEIKKSWLKFDLSGISQPITNAELRLTVQDAGTSRETLVGVFPAPNNWDESTITWNSAPVENPLWLAHDFFNGVPGDVRSYDVTGHVAEQINGFVSFCLADTFRQAQHVNFHSREASTPVHRPQLVINGTSLGAVADASVRSGAYAGTNYGTEPVLPVQDIWARDTRTTYDGGMEIDVFEWLGVWDPYRLHWALHWDGYYGDHTKTNGEFYIPGKTVAEYHTYGFYWEPGLIEFYFDGQSVGLFESNRVCSVPSFPILSLQMGGWSGNDNPDNIDESEYPGLMEVDYVKVWSGTRE